MLTPALAFYQGYSTGKGGVIDTVSIWYSEGRGIKSVVLQNFSAEFISGFLGTNFIPYFWYCKYQPLLEKNKEENDILYRFARPAAPSKWSVVYWQLIPKYRLRYQSGAADTAPSVTE